MWAIGTGSQHLAGCAVKARTQGAHALQARAPLPGSGLFAIRERGLVTGSARLLRLPAEVLGERLRDKAPRTRVGEQSCGRARPCGGAKRRCRSCLRHLLAHLPLPAPFLVGSVRT